jgi:hypothetical protein
MWILPGSKNDMTSSSGVLSSGCPISARHNPPETVLVAAVHGARPVRTLCHGPPGDGACQTVKSPPRLVSSTMTNPCRLAEKSPADTASGAV